MKVKVSKSMRLSVRRVSRADVEKVSAWVEMESEAVWEVVEMFFWVRHPRRSRLRMRISGRMF